MDSRPYIWNVDLILIQEKMRDLAEKLFNTRCGVMVEKVQTNPNMFQRWIQQGICHEFPGGHCPCRAKVGVWGWHRLHQVHFCQIQRPWPQVIPISIMSAFHLTLLKLDSLSQENNFFWNFFTNILTHPPGWEYGETKAMQRKTR